MVARPYLIEGLIKLVQNKSKKKIPEPLIENAVYFTLSSLMSSIGGIELVKEDESQIINYFGITLAGTGVGKDFALDCCRSVFKKIPDSFAKNTDAIFHKNKYSPSGECLYPQDDPDFYILPNDFFSPLDGTREGFQKLMQGMAQLEGTSLNMTEDELGDILSNNDMLSRIKSAWQDGSGKGKTTVGGKYFAVKNVPVNMLMYGSPHSIQKSKQKTELFEAVLLEGFLRRSFVFFEKQSLIIKNDKYKKMSKEDVDSITNHALELEDMIIGSKDIKIKVSISEEAESKLYDYEWELSSISNSDPSNQFKKAIANSTQKVERLSAIIALSDFSRKIEVSHVEVAISFANRTNEMAEQAIENESIHEQIFNFVRGDMKSRTDIISKVGISGARIFDEYIELSEEFGETKDYSLIRHEIGKIKYYKFEPLKAVDEKSITVSTSTKMGHEFQAQTGSWDKFGELLSKSINYSAGTFKDNHRTKDNYLGYQDVIILDIDGGMTLNMAKAFFGQWDCWIATTRNHQKLKNNVTTDRYRVVLLPIVKIEFTSEQFSLFMGNVINRLSVPADESCKDSSRFYFGYEGSEVWKSQSDKRFDIKCCIPETKKSETIKAIDKTIKNSGGIEKYFIREAIVGSRNTALFQYAAMMWEAGEDWKSKVMDLNSKLHEPLSEKEIEQTIFQNKKLNR